MHDVDIPIGVKEPLPYVLAAPEEEQMKSLMFAAALKGILAGCSTQTGIVPAGRGLYTASNMDYSSWSSGSAKVQLMKDATAFCAKSNKDFVL